MPSRVVVDSNRELPPSVVGGSQLVAYPLVARLAYGHLFARTTADLVVSLVARE